MINSQNIVIFIFYKDVIMCELPDSAGVKGIGGNISSRNVSKPDSSDAGLTRGSGLTLEIQPSGHVILGKKGITLSCIAGSNETVTWLHNGIPAPPCGLTRCVLLSNGSLHFYKVHVLIYFYWIYHC